MSKTNAIIKFLNAARSLANQGMSKEAIVQFAKNEFGEISELFQKQIDNIFKPKQGIKSVKIKDPDFDDTVVEMQFDEFGPFNPKDPLKNLKKQTKPMRYRGPDEFDTRKQYEEYLDSVLGPADEVFGNPLKDDLLREFDKVKIENVTPKKTEGIENISIEERMDRIKGTNKKLDDVIKEREEMFKPKKPRDEKYTGGMVDVEPNLSDIGHGSDSLMARTRLISPNNQATTSTGLNYLLAEDNDNIRVPFSRGKLADAARRKFMKAAGAGAAGIAALKTGLIGLGEKAAPVVEKAVETVQGTPQYFFDLVAKIKMFGKKSKIGPQERVDEYSYTGANGDDYTLTEDIVTGDASITKDKMGGVRVSEDEMTDGIVDRSVMEYKSGKGMADESTGGAFGDEYDEYKVEFDMDGTASGADKIDESVQKEIMEEASETIIKKAEGGRIGYSKGKLVFENAAKFLEKVFGKENMAEMPNRDPEMYQGMLEVVDMFRNRDKEGLKKYLQKFLPHMDDAEIEDFIIGSDGTEGITGQLIRLGSGRDYKGKLDMIKEAGEKRKLSDIEVTEEMIRKPNAYGGLAKMLGE